MFAVPFDAATATVTGPAVALIDDLRVSQTGGVAMFAVSSRGDLAYVTESSGDPDRQLVWLDRAGDVVSAAEQRKRYLSAALAPDGRRAAVTIQGDNRDLWIYTFERGILSRLTGSPDTEFDPAWWPPIRSPAPSRSRPEPTTSPLTASAFLR
jgi:hypothetical protein